MQRQTENLANVENPLGEVARILGYSKIARLAGTCHQSVSKWSKDTGDQRESTDRVITASVLAQAQHIANLLALHNSRTSPVQADAQTVSNFADADA